MTDVEGEAPLGVSITGPGPAHAELADSTDCSTVVLCTARTAGDYVLSVFDLASGALLFGSPFKVNSMLVACCQFLGRAGMIKRMPCKVNVWCCACQACQEQTCADWLLQATPSIP